MHTLKAIAFGLGMAAASAAHADPAFFTVQHVQIATDCTVISGEDTVTQGPVTYAFKGDATNVAKNTAWNALVIAAATTGKTVVAQTTGYNLSCSGAGSVTQLIALGF